MKHDTEYERRGNASIFMFAAPKIGYRRVSVLDRITIIDFTNKIYRICNKDFPDAKKIIFSLRQSEYHKPSSLYEAFPPEKKRELARRIEFHYTPIHGSWLNMAEIEFSDLKNHGLKQ
jgi:hypothetical protein